MKVRVVVQSESSINQAEGGSKRAGGRGGGGEGGWVGMELIVGLFSDATYRKKPSIEKLSRAKRG